MFEVIFSSAAKKFLKNADNNVYGRIMQKVEELAIDPFPKGVERVTGREEKTFRVRVGDYRILYSVFYEKNEITVTNIDKRSRAYD